MNRISTERPQKRPRSSLPHPSPRRSFDQDPASSLSDSRCRHISHWAHEGQVWPDGFSKEDKFEEDKMFRVLARKKSSAPLRRKRSEPSSTTQSSAMPSDQRPKEEKSAPYFQFSSCNSVRHMSLWALQELLAIPTWTSPKMISQEGSTWCKRKCFRTPSSSPLKVISNLPRHLLQSLTGH